MILTVEAGNVNMVFAGFENGELAFVSRADTVLSRTGDQYAVLIRSMLELNGVSPDDVEGCAAASVVPPVTARLEYGIEKLLGIKPLTVSPGVKTGLNIKIDDPSTLGSDLVCAAVAAKEKYPAPCVFADAGTCLKIAAIDKSGAMPGGVIAPGINMSFEALAARTASLPLTDARSVSSVIGTNSADSMRSGVIVGAACIIDGMISRFEQTLGECAAAMITGDSAEYILPYCRHEMIYDPCLVQQGLYIIYNKNKPKK